MKRAICFGVLSLVGSLFAGVLVTFAGKTLIVAVILAAIIFYAWLNVSIWKDINRRL